MATDLGVGTSLGISADDDPAVIGCAVTAIIWKGDEWPHLHSARPSHPRFAYHQQHYLTSTLHYTSLNHRYPLITSHQTTPPILPNLTFESPSPPSREHHPTIDHTTLLYHNHVLLLPGL
jgi:hypothetical protein